MGPAQLGAAPGGAPGGRRRTSGTASRRGGTGGGKGAAGDRAALAPVGARSRQPPIPLQDGWSPLDLTGRLSPSHILRARCGRAGPGNGPGVIWPPFSASEREGEGSWVGTVARPAARTPVREGFLWRRGEGARRSPHPGGRVRGGGVWGRPAGRAFAPARAGSPGLETLARPCRAGRSPILAPGARARVPSALPHSTPPPPPCPRGVSARPSPRSPGHDIGYRASPACQEISRPAPPGVTLPPPGDGYPTLPEACPTTARPGLPCPARWLPYLHPEMVTLPSPMVTLPSAGRGYPAMPGGYPAQPEVTLPPRLARGPSPGPPVLPLAPPRLPTAPPTRPGATPPPLPASSRPAPAPTTRPPPPVVLPLDRGYLPTPPIAGPRARSLEAEARPTLPPLALPPLAPSLSALPSPPLRLPSPLAPQHIRAGPAATNPPSHPEFHPSTASTMEPPSPPPEAPPGPSLRPQNSPRPVARSSACLHQLGHVPGGTNLDDVGLASVYRNNKATLPLTAPSRAIKSSAKDLSPPIVKLSSNGKDLRLVRQGSRCRPRLIRGP